MTDVTKAEQHRAALELFLNRVREDPYILAVVQIGTLAPELMWCRDGLQLWIIESDSVSLRRKSDGEQVRIFRTYVEDEVNVWAEIIPRSRFKLMIEGAARTAFSHNHFAVRQLVYSDDASIEKWFDGANRVATKDQRLELFAITTWLIHAARHARRLLDLKKNVARAHGQVLSCGWILSAMAIVEAGEICEDDAIARGRELAPELMAAVFDPLAGKAAVESVVRAALERIEEEIADTAPARLDAVTKYIEKQARLVPLSELGDQWAYTQLYPGHLEDACEWLAGHGHLDKISTATRITKKSSVEFEEPAYQVL